MTLLERMAWISDLILQAELVYANEYDLQEGIHAALELGGARVDKEVTFEQSGGRIDMFAFVDSHDQYAPGIGIEVKIEGSHASVLRQLSRYAAEPSIAGLVLVTTRSKHHRIPFELNGKPVRLVSLIGAGL